MPAHSPLVLALSYPAHWQWMPTPRLVPRTRSLPPVATAGLVLAGLGLIGMTADELPGIPERMGIPAWALGALGGVLIASALTPRLLTGLPGRIHGPGSMLGVGAVAGALLVALGHVAGVVGTDPRLEQLASAINTTGRVLFGIGAGVVLGWVASEASGTRPP
jgi:hypothetical protein